MVKDPLARTPDHGMAADVSNRLKERGFLTAPAGAFGNVVKIRPPLVFTQSDAEEFLEAFDATVAEIHG
jgi:4-aminobutyrate aminotransferase-like enzyme